ncbi:MAG TPA: transporter substrate-binding domain-containing protein, partial [Bryobacteraceae bacterium]|nr:transporter substrate-binding domain-containing protein [Bryobacteraceae bacterium]
MGLHAGRFALISVTLLCLGCGIPRDPEHTLERVQHQRQVRVGVSENPPWVSGTADVGEPNGAEVTLVRQFAAELAAKPVWIRGSEQQHMEALRRFELDMAIAGFDNTT